MKRSMAHWRWGGLVIGFMLWSLASSGGATASLPEFSFSHLKKARDTIVLVAADEPPSPREDSLWDKLNPYNWARSAAERLHGYVRDQLVAYLNTTFRGEISIGKTAGSVLGGLTFYDVALRYEGTEVLSIPRLTVEYNLLQLVRGRVQITQVQGLQPVLRLKQDAEGRWNILEAFAAKGEETPEEPEEEGGFDILLDKATFQGAQIAVTPAGQDAGTYHLTETDLDLGIDIVTAGVNARVRQLTSQVTGPSLPPVQVNGALTYLGAATPATVQISKLALDTTQSHLRVTGAISDLETMQTQAQLDIDNLAVEDVAQIMPTWPLKEDISGAIQVSGPRTQLRTELALAAADARITADVQTDLSQDAPHYQGTLTIAHFDAQKLLTRKDLAGVVEGTVRIKEGVGASLADLQGEADIQARAVQVADWQVGNVSVNGSMDQQLAKLTGTLHGDVGQATWEGSLNLADAQPRYALTLSVDHLDVKKAAPGAEPVTTDLNLTGTASGAGFALAELEAQSEITVRPSTVGQVKIERGRLGTRVADGRVHIDELTLNAKDTRVAVQGEVGTTTEQTGQLTYTLRVGDVSPWLSLADQRGAGALALTGTAKGSFANMHVQGELTANDLRVADSAIQSGVVNFTLTEIGQPTPYGVITAKAQDIRAGVTLQAAEATITVPQGQRESAPLTAQVDVTVQDVAARTHHVQGEVSYQPEQTTARLTTVQIESPDGTWRLAQPTRIVQDKDGIAVEELRMVNKDQRIVLDGRAALAGNQNLRLQIDRFALAALQPLLPPQPDVRGLVSAQAEIGGTAAAPRLTSTLKLADLQIAGQAYAGLDASIGYEKQQASLALTFQQDATHTLTAKGALPVAVSWADGWKTQELGDLDLRVRSAGVNLAFLNAFTGKAVQDVAGEFSVDMTIRGPLASPLPRGSFQLRGGQAQVNPLGVRIADIAVGGQLDPEQVRIERFSAKAGEGQLSGNGAIALRDHVPQQISLSLSADRWPAIQTKQYHVVLGGQLQGRGPLNAPNISGRLQIPEATLRPDLEFLQAEPVKPDETIIVIPAKGSSESATSPTPIEQQQKEESAPQQNDLFTNLALDVDVAIPRNTWIRHNNADIELSGEVQVQKQQGGDLVLVGTIETVRGWVAFQGRRFTLTEGQVTFTGGSPIDPTLNIIAQYKLPDYAVEITVGGTIQQPTLTLQSDPALEQADILALLIFGKPTSELGQGEKFDLQKQALDVVGGYAAARIADSVSDALGLEELGIDLRQVDLASGRVGFGRYLSPNTYVSVSQDVAGKGGREVNVEYNLAPDWKITTSTSAAGDNSAGIVWQKQY